MTLYPSPKDIAVHAICGWQFHQTLWLPETATHSKLKVTFATTTNFDDLSLPAVLFIGPMCCTRWSIAHFESLPRRCGVRVICVDRPSFGGSTPVSINMRMQVWLETVPALLQQLDVKHVALVTHSAGAIYTLNTLFHHRSILDPKAPYVAFLAPWVSTAHSGAALTTMAAVLPTNLLDSCACLITFINRKIMPSASWSGGIFSSTAALLSSSASTDTAEAETSNLTMSSERSSFLAEAEYFTYELAFKYQYAENMTGANEEAKLCLRKCDDADWGEAVDYPKCIHKIAVNETSPDGGSHETNAAKLSVDAFFSGADNMIAKRGQRYFEQCWQSDEVKKTIDFTTRTFPKASHNSILNDVKKGALKVVFEKIAKLGKDV